MCGIVGFLDRRAATAGETLEQLAGAMAGTLAARGPDGQGVWVDAASGVGLGHRRLAIIDVSDAGAQPMLSSCGRLVISYNGEIYNFRDLRAELEALGHRFRGHSDTEVILEACIAWGVEGATRRLAGMFAFALWDREQRRLWLVRDRVGIKPLYWGWQGDVLFFGSTLRSFAPHPDWRPQIDRNALAACLRFTYIPAPLSAWQGIAKLRPGHIVTIGPDGATRETCYWDIRAVACDGSNRPLRLGDAEAAEKLHHLLRETVRQHLVADVPVGAFLSGGIDSSTVVALMQAEASRPVKTFTIGFRQQDHDEAAYAYGVAKHLGTDHTELYLEDADLLGLVPQAAEFFDEPFADASQIPTYLVSKLARSAVTVSLSGDGGDELFAGYTRYALARNIHGWFHFLPSTLRRSIAAALTSLAPARWDAVCRVLPGLGRPELVGDRLHKFAAVLDFTGPTELYRRLVSSWDDPVALVRHAEEQPIFAWDDPQVLDTPDFTERMQLIDLLTYLPDMILAKLDRASMAASLEGRVPLLDHRIAEFASHLPMAMKVRGGKTKWLLRQVLHQYVPSDLLERPKMGFTPPTGAWLRGPLRAWAEDLLDPRQLAAGDLLDPRPIRRRWREHLSGERNWAFSLWSVLMIQAWRRRWGQAY